MTRTTARELAILLGFSLARDETAAEAAERFFEPEHYASLAEESPLFAEAPGEAQLNYIVRVAGLMNERRAELDGYIRRYARGWTPERLSRTAAAILRCAMAEILYVEDVPTATAIDEAVELAKKYETAETVAFLNGVLGGFVRGELCAETGPVPDAEA